MTTQDLIALADEYATQMVRSGNGRLSHELRAALLAALTAQEAETSALYPASAIQQAVAQEWERNAGVLRQAREALEELHYASTDKAYAMGTAACVAIDGVLKL